MPDSILARARPLMAARLAGAALTFAVPLVLARVLVPASYGTFKQAWLLSQTLALVLPLGLTQSLYYFVPRDPARRDRYVAQTAWALLAVGAASALLLILARPWVAAHFENPELTRNLPWVAAFTAFTVAGAPLDVAWNATGRIGAAALARVATEGGRGAAMVAGALLWRSVEGVFAGIALATAARAALSLWLLARRHGLRGDLALLRRQVAYALPFGLAFVLIVPQQQWHQYAVAAAVSAAAFAVYSVGTFQLPVVDVLYTPVSELLQIGLAEHEGAGRPPRAGLALFHEAVLQLSFAFVPLAGLLAVAAPVLVPFLFSPRYAAAVPIFRLATGTVLLAALPLDGVMRARAQNRFMLALSAGKLGATAALVSAGLALLGPIGALAGWTAAEAAARAAMLVRTARLFEAPLRQALPVRALARQAVATAVAAPAAWVALNALAAPPFFRLAACGLAFAAAYLGVSWAFGWLPAGWVGLFRARRAGRTPAAPPESA
ncbi:polysaccharide biosynthesis protein [Anaeromyxobacter sp. K]|uniref:lipopolysaccharide biosynthesis protein n=1 Tax=Anaeromyxobacter sp. (strain K) TaxID=447217 RepID=UPI00015F93FE|nr:oligosaccharide flippase family protein [Anaeromyxobacter sp. K]ACG75417.1 polysaccharide biosynthesis protein [Anaeromyxobacter sp. K]